MMHVLNSHGTERNFLENDLEFFTKHIDVKSRAKQILMFHLGGSLGPEIHYKENQNQTFPFFFNSDFLFHVSNHEKILMTDVGDRCWRQMLETKCGGDNSKMLVLAVSVTNIHYRLISPQRPTSRCHQHQCNLQNYILEEIPRLK